MTSIIPFNQPHFSGKETDYIKASVSNKQISGNGYFTKRCQDYFNSNYGVKKSFLTTSCTDALEMTGLLMDIKEGDEVIMPSYTFVSTANAYRLRGAVIRFVDSKFDHPSIDESKIEEQINDKTKAIVVVHYAGVACDMDVVLKLAKQYNLLVVEDSAQAIDSFYKGKPLGTIGDFGTFSFHETKNIISGEGGLLAVNNPKYVERAEIIWEKGTNRVAFWRGEVAKYNWVDIGSSYLPSEIIAAFLLAQLENLQKIQTKRMLHWNLYYSLLSEIDGDFKLPVVPDYASNNGHIFYLTCSSLNQRNQLIEFLKQKKITAVFHYLGLHRSPYHLDRNKRERLINCEKYADRLVRLPMYYDLTESQISYIVSKIRLFFESKQ